MNPKSDIEEVNLKQEFINHSQKRQLWNLKRCSKGSKVLLLHRSVIIQSYRSTKCSQSSTMLRISFIKTMLVASAERIIFTIGNWNNAGKWNWGKVKNRWLPRRTSYWTHTTWYTRPGPPSQTSSSSSTSSTCRRRSTSKSSRKGNKSKSLTISWKVTGMAFRWWPGHLMTIAITSCERSTLGNPKSIRIIIFPISTTVAAFGNFIRSKTRQAKSTISC